MLAFSPDRTRLPPPIVPIVLALVGVFLIGAFAVALTPGASASMAPTVSSGAIPSHPASAAPRGGAGSARSIGANLALASAARAAAHPAGSAGPIGGRLYSTTETTPVGYTSTNVVAVDNVTQTVYSANEYAANINMISIATGQLLHTYGVGGAGGVAFPTDIVENHSLNRVYVSVADSRFPGYVLVLNATNLDLVANVTHINGTQDFQPASLLFDSDTAQLVIENETGAIVAIMNTATNTIATVLTSPCVGYCGYSGGMADVPTWGYVVVPNGQSYVRVIDMGTDTWAGGFSNGLAAGWTGGSAAYDPTDDWVFMVNASGGPDLWAFDAQTGAAYAPWGFPVYSVTALAWDSVAQMIIVAQANETIGQSGQIIVDNVNGSAGYIYSNPNQPAPWWYSEVVTNDWAGGTGFVTAGVFNDTTTGFALSNVSFPSITPTWTLPSFAIVQGILSAVDPANGIFYVGSYLDVAGVLTITAYLESNPSTPLWNITPALDTQIASMVVDPQGTLLYVAYWYNSTAGEGTVSVYSASTGTWMHDIDFGTAISWPGSLAVDSMNDRLYVGAYFDSNVTVFSTTGGTYTSLGVVQNPAVAGAYCDMVANSATDSAYATNCATPGNVSVISAASLSVTHIFPVGADPIALGFGSSGTLFVANAGSNNITVLDTTTNATLNTIHVAFGPDNMAVDPTSDWLYTTNTTTNSITVVNGTSGVVLGALAPPGLSIGPVFDSRTFTLIAPIAFNGTTYLASLVPLPLAPTGVTAVGGNATVTVSWTASAGSPGAPITSYTVFTAANAAGPWTLNVTTSSTSATIDQLANGVKVYVSIRAVSAAGTSANTSAVGATPGGVPYPPTAFAATANGTSEIDLSWAAPAVDGGFAVTNYTVWYWATGGAYIPVSAGTSTTLKLTGLTAGTMYSAYVVAYNSIGHSNPSTMASAKTQSSSSSSSGGLGSLGSYWWVLVIVVVAIVALAAILLMRRRGKPSAAAAGTSGGTAGGASSPPPPWSESGSAPPPPPPSSGGGPPPGAV